MNLRFVKEIGLLWTGSEKCREGSALWHSQSRALWPISLDVIHSIVKLPKRLDVIQAKDFSPLHRM